MEESAFQQLLLFAGIPLFICGASEQQCRLDIFLLATPRNSERW